MIASRWSRTLPFSAVLERATIASVQLDGSLAAQKSYFVHKV